MRSREAFMKAPTSSGCDAAVIGGGPAGAVAAMLLAAWGHRVVVFTRAARVRQTIAESLPPSIQKLLARVGALEAVDAAGFYRSRGNTVWWESQDARVEPFPHGALGYQVMRGDLDRLLLDLAHRSGATVRHASVRAVALLDDQTRPARIEYQANGGLETLEAPWVLDASGRAALVARAMELRVPEPGHRTTALIGEWRRERPWEVPDETHTLVESYEDGWAWSVPTSPLARQVAVMVDPRRGVTALAEDRRLVTMYQAELAKTTHLRRLTNDAALWGTPTAHDASLYGTTRACGPGFLLVGDAGSFIDPLTSLGVKKALASAWLGAVVVHTALKDPSMAALGLELFASREREMYAAFRRLTALQFGHVAQRRDHPFWNDRAEVPGLDEMVDPAHEGGQTAAVVEAFEGLKRSPTIHLAPTVRWRIARRPAVHDREVILDDHLETPDGRSMRFLRGVNVVTLGAMVQAHTQVPGLFEAYIRHNPAVPLPDFLVVLATLLAEGVVEHRPPASV